MDRLTDRQHYVVTTWNDDRFIAADECHDPFHRTDVVVEISYTFRERLAVLFGRTTKTKVTVSTSADPDVTAAVMRLSRTDDGTIVLPEAATTGPVSTR